MKLFRQVGDYRDIDMQINLNVKLFFNEEQEDWAKLTPEQRYLESAKLWPIYLEFGGSFDPEPDSQSPFDFPELRRSIPAHGRSGVHFIRRS
jgi:hypothetical protein